MDNCLNNFNKDYLINKLADEIENCREFQSRNNYNKFSFTTSHCRIDSVIIDWDNVNQLELSFQNKLELLFVMNHLSNGDYTFPMNSKSEAESTLFILNTQLDSISAHHCKWFSQMTIAPCMYLHWKLHNILVPQHADKVIFLSDEYAQLAEQKTVSNNFEIRMPVRFDSIVRNVDWVCVKTLEYIQTSGWYFCFTEFLTAFDQHDY